MSKPIGGGSGPTATTTAANDDTLLIWRDANGDVRTITKANLLTGLQQGTITITGTGTLALSTFTLTVPATGTAALLATAQSFTALKTFSAGLTFGQDTLNYYDQGTFVPVVADATAAGNTATVGTTVGQYIRIGNFVKCWVSLFNINTTGMTGGNTLYVRDLPFTAQTVTSYQALGVVSLVTFTISGYPVARVLSNTSYVDFPQSVSTTTQDVLTVSDVGASTSDLIFEISYLTA